MSGKKYPPKEPIYCSLCGREFWPSSNYIEVCDECKEFVKGYRSMKNGYDVRAEENRIRLHAYVRAMACYERIKGEGYAERQVEKTLAMVPKIKTDL